MKESDDLKDRKERTSKILDKLSSASYDALKGLSKEQRKLVINAFIIPNSDNPDFNPTPEDIMTQAALLTRDSVRSVTSVPPPIPADVINGGKRESDVRPPTGPAFPAIPSSSLPRTDPEARFFGQNGLPDDTLRLQVDDLEEIRDDSQPFITTEGTQLPPAPLADDKNGDKAPQPDKTGDLEFLPHAPEATDEPDVLIEPAEAPGGPEYVFTQLLNESKREEAFMMWLEADGALDDVLFENIDEDEDLIRAFVRMSCAEARMLDDAIRLVDKTKDKIDFRHQVGSICLKLYFDGENEMLDEVISKFSHVFDFSIFKAYSELIEVRKELEESRKEIIRGQDALVENGRLKGQLASKRGDLEQAEKVQASLRGDVVARDQKINEKITELLVISKRLETAFADNSKLEKLLDGERNVNVQAALQKSTLETTLNSERERRIGSEQRSAESEAKLKAESISKKDLGKEYADYKADMEKELARFRECLRLAEQKVNEHRTSVMSEQLDNAALRKRAITGEQAALNINTVQTQLDAALHTIQTNEAKLAEMELANGSLEGKLKEAGESVKAGQEAQSAEFDKVRGRNDELFADVQRLEKEKAELNANLTILEPIERKYLLEHQRADTLQTYLDEERKLCANLKQQLAEAVRPPQEAVQGKPADGTETTEYDPVINSFYERIISGDIKGAVQCMKKHGLGKDIVKRPGYTDAVRKGFCGLLALGNVKEAARFRNKFGDNIDFSKDLKQIYRECLDQNLIELSIEIRDKFGDEVDFLS